MDKAFIRELAHKYIEGLASPEEQETLHHWYDEVKMDDEEVVVTPLAESFNDMQARMLARIMEATCMDQPSNEVVRPIHSMVRRYWATAAMVSGLLLGFYFFFKKPADPTGNLTIEQKLENDIATGGNKATLTLANGRKIGLDSISVGWVLADGGATFEKTDDGQLVYKAAKTAGTVNAIHTISTPIGGEFALELPDGSKVWLNALSTLKFPAKFSEKERRVEMTGEAYFEVAKNTSKAFIVEIGRVSEPGYQRVEVLGTHFNIRAYPVDKEIATTLAEGKIRVSSQAENKIILPGQQTLISENGKIELNDNADIDAVLGWHNGLFRFNNLTIREIMSEAERWYGIEVHYEGNLVEHFNSGIERTASLQDFLSILEATGRVKFLVDGKKVTVSAKQ